MSAGGTRSSANEHTAEELFVTQRCAPREGTPDCPPRSGLTCLHSIRRPVCTNKRGIGRTPQNLTEARAVQSLAIALKPRVRAHPHAPRLVRHSILNSFVRALRRISPVMLADEIFQSAFRHPRWSAVRPCAQPESLAAPFPPVFRRCAGRIPLDAMRHRARIISFDVHHPRQPGDCDAWHKFAHKHHAPSDFAALATPHIKTQIYFVEIAVEGNCQESVKLGVQKLKTHEAYKSPPLKLIQLNSARNVLPQNSRLDFVVQHH